MIVIRLVWGTVGGVTAREKSFRKDALMSPQLRRPAHGARVRVTAQHVVAQGKSKWAVRAGSPIPKKSTECDERAPPNRSVFGGLQILAGRIGSVQDWCQSAGGELTCQNRGTDGFSSMPTRAKPSEVGPTSTLAWHSCQVVGFISRSSCPKETLVPSGDSAP
jgi:hypothetical protein